MSNKELDRLEVVRRVLERRLTQREGAVALGVSERQMGRLCRAYREQGPEGLVSKKRGRRSNRQYPDCVRELATRLVCEHYRDFGPTLAAEKLAENHRVFVSRETLRQWMVQVGVWTPRKLRRRTQQPRRRRECLGELVQIDGCEHHWFEDRAPKCTLLVFVDDATSRLMQLRFVPSESTFSYFEATGRYIRRHGKPVAFYSDKASIFRVTPRKGSTESKGITQFARALSDLNIDIVCANTPAAKGRVERAHLTLQDRLVKELRLREISSIDEANRFAEEYMELYNERFARVPLSDHDAHRPLLATEDLGRAFAWQEQRKLTKNLTLSYKHVTYVVEPTPENRNLTGRRCEVYEWEDGRVELVCDGRVLAFTAYDKRPFVNPAEIVTNKRLGAALLLVQKQQQARDYDRLSSPKVTLRDKQRIRDKVSPADVAMNRTFLNCEDEDISKLR